MIPETFWAVFADWTDRGHYGPAVIGSIIIALSLWNIWHDLK